MAYRNRIPVDEPVRTFGDRFGYWLGESKTVAWLVPATILGGVVAAVAGPLNCANRAEAMRDIAAMQHDSIEAKGACRDVWLSTEDRKTLSCPHVKHHLTANAQWIRCECSK